MKKKMYVSCLISVIFCLFMVSAASAERLFPDSFYESDCASHPDTKICKDFYRDTGKTPPTQPEYVTTDFKVFVDGTELQFDQKPVLLDDFTLVPLRKIFEALGATVNYELGVITASNGNVKVVCGIGQTTAKINDVETTISVAPQIVNNATMVPARFIAQSFGAVVEFDQKTKIINISTAKA
ncbi:copper amine oxidase N-terminal domain-containing protein [Cohnella nanjingensis]|uniref:Copper amine oxidase-like N-terminal domain-containing protein n=1 Tax=Cohnella nanjingensis TaxID=1387779 RepID=A0A7X0RQM0_9BACL|nr:copper amine oxidase N-terminal domain-containing protein [Cohnella nanjingensis]MBB6671765.1 hypothetical protein [Cohnella nanjingensis]